MAIRLETANSPKFDFCSTKRTTSLIRIVSGLFSVLKNGRTAKVPPARPPVAWYRLPRFQRHAQQFVAICFMATARFIARACFESRRLTVHEMHVAATGRSLVEDLLWRRLLTFWNWEITRTPVRREA